VTPKLVTYWPNFVVIRKRRRRRRRRRRNLTLTDLINRRDTTLHEGKKNVFLAFC